MPARYRFLQEGRLGGAVFTHHGPGLYSGVHLLQMSVRVTLGIEMLLSEYLLRKRGRYH
jgi:hypothetical protein